MRCGLTLTGEAINKFFLPQMHTFPKKKRPGAVHKIFYIFWGVFSGLSSAFSFTIFILVYSPHNSPEKSCFTFFSLFGLMKSNLKCCFIFFHSFMSLQFEMKHEMKAACLLFLSFINNYCVSSTYFCM